MVKVYLIDTNTVIDYLDDKLPQKPISLLTELFRRYQ